MNGTPLQSEAPKRDLPQLILCVAFILVPAALFSLKSDLPHVAIVCSLILAFSLLKRKPIPMSDRPIIYFAVLSMALATFLDMAIPMNNSRNGVLDILISSSLTAPALLYMASFATLFEQKPLPFGMIAAFAISATLSGGDIYSDSRLVPERLLFAKPLMAHFSAVYRASVALELLLLVACLQRLRSYSKEGVSRAALFSRAGVRFALLAALPLLAVAGTLSYYANEKSFRKLERYLATSSFLRRAQQEALPFSGEPDLTKGLPKEDPRKAAMIVARVKSPRPPGLLRARGFSTYNAGHWSGDSAKRQLAGTRHSETISSLLFNMPGWDAAKDDKKLKRFEVFQSRKFAGDVLLLPANARSIEIVAQKLSVSADGLVEASEWKPDAGFTARASSVDPFSGYKEPSGPAIPQAYLAVPDSLKNAIAEIAEQTKAQAEQSKFKGDAALAAAVSTILRNRCQYSLESSDCPAGEDPVARFLLKTRKGHCELFASAAVMTLRSLGVPARYATGLVCDETHPSGSYFVARYGGYHAWCEAYLQDQGRWVAVDATPASEFDPVKAKWGVFEAISDWFAQTFRQAFTWLQRGYFAEALIELAGDCAMAAWAVAASKAGIAVETIFALAALAYGVRRLKRALATRPHVPETILLLRKSFKRVENAACARSGVRREEGATLGEWAASASSSCGSEIAGLVRDYESLRYRQSPPSPEAAEDFSKRADAFAKKLRKAK